jgi:hypothetical protein
MNSRFEPQVWGQGPGPVAIAITLSKQSAQRYQRARDRAKFLPPEPAKGGFPYPARSQRLVRLHEESGW